MQQHQSLSSLSDKDWQLLLTYHCALFHRLWKQQRHHDESAEEETEVGFVVVVDRRHDSWTATNALLAKLQHLFPCRIARLVLLPPQSLLQKSIHGVGLGFRNGFHNFPVSYAPGVCYHTRAHMCVS